MDETTGAHEATDLLALVAHETSLIRRHQNEAAAHSGTRREAVLRLRALGVSHARIAEAMGTTRAAAQAVARR